MFGVQTDVPLAGGNMAQRREHDRRIGAGTMSRSGATCPMPGCGAIMTMGEIRAEGLARRLGSVMTAVVVDGQKGKEYRTPTDEEIRLAAEAEQGLDRVFAEVPFGLPDEPLPSTEALGIRVPLYGFDRWSKLFTPRQLLALGTFCKHIRNARQAMQASDYEREWAKGISAFLSCALARLADDSSTVCLWALNEFLCHTFTRFALPITWDFVEGNPLGNTSGNFWGAMDWVARFADHATKSARNAPIGVCT